MNTPLILDEEEAARARRPRIGIRAFPKVALPQAFCETIPTPLLVERRLLRAGWLLTAPPLPRQAPSGLPQSNSAAWTPGPQRTGEHLPPPGQVLRTRRGRRSPPWFIAAPVQWHLGRCDRGRSSGSSFPAHPDGTLRSAPDCRSGPFERPSFRQKPHVLNPRPIRRCRSGVRAVGMIGVK